MTSISDVYILRKLAIVETVDFLRKAWAERNICTWVLGFEISIPRALNQVFRPPSRL